MEIEESRLKEFLAGKLFYGSHTREQAELGQRCANEWLAYLAKEEHSDSPSCVGGTVRRFTMRLNDRWTARKAPSKSVDAFRALLPRCVGTVAPIEVERRRAWLCADWSMRELLPMLLDAAGEKESAAKLRALSTLTSEASAKPARGIAQAGRRALWGKYKTAYAAAAADDAAADDAADAAYAYAAAYAADAAADAAAYAAADAAAAAAYAAAYAADAAAYAADAADAYDAYDAYAAAADADAADADAAYAADDAAYDAAYDAARRVKLASLVDRCDEMALELLGRMIERK